tara:strand:+ start:1109 stop:1261 length:153 start_codon:yes stop_codon:yes gene_type:complete
MPNKLQYHKRRLIARGLAKPEDFGEKKEKVEKKSDEKKSEVEAEEEKSEE